MDDIFDKMEEDIENVGKEKLLPYDDPFSEDHISYFNHNINKMEEQRYHRRYRSECRCGRIYVIEYKAKRMRVADYMHDMALMTMESDTFYCIGCGYMHRVSGKIIKIYGEHPVEQWMNWRI
jgi:hypothetical protein